MTKRPDVATEARDPGNQSPRDPAADTPARGISKDLLLATYIEQATPDNFTEEAKAALLLEVKQYTQDICELTKVRRRADRNSEKALRHHVADSASFLRNKSENLLDVLGDWGKWIGFTFLGFTVQQWIHIHHEKPISSGSVTWLTIDIVASVAFIFTGFAVDKPWGYFAKWLRRN